MNLEEVQMTQEVLNAAPVRLSIKNEKTTNLTSAQKEFNRLIKKVGKLKQQLYDMPEKERLLADFYEKEIKPIEKEYMQAGLDLLDALDDLYESKNITKRRRVYLADLIFKQACNFEALLGGERDENFSKEIEPIILKYSEITGKEKEDESAFIDDMFIRLAQEELGLDLSKLKEIEDVEERNEYFHQALEDYRAQQEADSQEKAAKKKLTKKELLAKAQEDALNKSLREVYTDLVKAFHPDQEQDEEKRLIKEEKMKQITEAYQKKDLSTLLFMQIEWLEVSSKTPQSQSDETLKSYNKILKQQVANLQEEMFIASMTMQIPFNFYEEAEGDIFTMDLKRVSAWLKKIKNITTLHVCEIYLIRESTFDRKTFFLLLDDYGTGMCY